MSNAFILNCNDLRFELNDNAFFEMGINKLKWKLFFNVAMICINRLDSRKNISKCIFVLDYSIR